MDFPVPDEEAVMTTNYVTDDRLPILYVSHDRDEDSESGGFWQFHCGNNDYAEDRLRLVRLDTILQLDPSIRQLALEHGALRKGPLGKFSRRNESLGP